MIGDEAGGDGRGDDFLLCHYLLSMAPTKAQTHCFDLLWICGTRNRHVEQVEFDPIGLN